MRRRVFRWMIGVGTSVLVLNIYLILFQTHFYSTLVIDALNGFVLRPVGLHLEGRITGGLTSREFGLENSHITVMATGDTLGYLGSIQSYSADINWGFNHLNIDRVTLHNFQFDVAKMAQLQPKGSRGSAQFDITIGEIFLSEGSIKYPTRDTTAVIDLADLTGELWYLDRYAGLAIQESRLQHSLFPDDTLGVTGRLGFSPGGSISIADFMLKGPSMDLAAKGQYEGEVLNLRLLSQDLRINDLPRFDLPAYYRDLRMDVDLSYQYDSLGAHVVGSGLIKQQGQRIPFELYRLEWGGSTLRTLANIGSEFSYLGVMLTVDSTGFTQGNIDVLRPKLNPFIPTDVLDVSEMIGTVRFSGTKDRFTVIPTVSQIVVNDIKLEGLSTKLVKDGAGNIEVSPGSLTQGRNTISFAGSMKGGRLDLETMLTLSDYEFLKRMGKVPDIDGDLSLDLKISGPQATPRFVGKFETQSLGLASNLSLTGAGKFDFTLDQDRLMGEFAMKGSDGVLFNDSLVQFSIGTTVNDSAFVLNELHLQGKSNLIAASGNYSQSGIFLNKLNMRGSGHQLKLVDRSFIARSQDDQFIVPPMLLAFNQGGLSIDGTYSQSTGYDLASDFELINFEQLMEFLRVKIDFKGLASGKAYVSGKLFDPVFQAMFHMDNGSTLGYPSDSAWVDVTLSKRGAMANEIKASSRGGKLLLSGQLPWGYAVKGESIRSTAQNFTINIDNYDLEDLKFTSIAGLSLSGRASGTATLRGTPADTKMDGRIRLHAAKYDTLSFNEGYLEFGYEDNLLTFDTLSMVSPWGYGSGSGYMPISLDMIAEDRLSAQDRDLGLQFEFNLNEMPFLTSYISSIDAIQGDFIGNLNFSGPFHSPIRDGKIRGHNSRLEVSVLGNPITDIHAEITLVDNTMTIDHFSGRMRFSEGSALNVQGFLGKTTSFISDLIGVKVAQQYSGQINARGEINFDSFFEPVFDVNILAKEVYYRSTDGLIEAIADGEMHFSGQDTLDVTAIIPVKRAVYYANFESTESYQQSVSKVESSVFKYSLNTQFPSDLLISNDQMEAEFEGELWLLDYGDGIMRFSGTLTTQEGGKFYYLGNELTILGGEIIFNTVDFNPQISMQASIEIDGELVTLILTGDLSEPELVISAENTQLTQSDVLAYLTINQKLVEVSFDTKSALNPVRTYSEMLVEKQISKIAREFTGLDILDVGINLDSDTTAVSRFEVGQRLSKNLKITYGSDLQPVEGKAEYDYDFGLEYRINQNVSVTTKINQNGEVELNGRLKYSY